MLRYTARKNNLNLDTIEFKSLNPTAENIAKVIYDILREKIEMKFEFKYVINIHNKELLE